MMSVFLGQLDAFDPARAKEFGDAYAGELCLCAVQSESLIQAIRTVLDVVEAEGVVLKTMDWFGPALEYDGDPSTFDVEISDLTKEATKSKSVVFSNVVAYESDG